MSNALAIAGVTAVLRDLLNEGLVNHNMPTSLGIVRVTSEPPDIIVTGTSEEDRLNLFLYAVTPNQGWRNQGFPTRDANGERVSNEPPLALDLHYLLTAYGTKSFHPEILLGYGMQILHETPVLTRDGVRKALSPLPAPPLPPNPPVPVDPSFLPGSYPLLIAADLADQAEQIRITPHYMGTEEISRLWTATKASYRATCAYIVSVVLIEPRRPVRSTLPVQQRNLLVLPFARPQIDTLTPQLVAAGETMTVRGRNLRGQITRVLVVDGQGHEEDVVPTDLRPESFTITIPETLAAGTGLLTVLQPLDFGTGAATEPHEGFKSNTAAFMVLPRIAPVPPLPPLPNSVAAGGNLLVPVRPPVAATQRVIVLLGDRSFLIPARPDGSPPTNQLALKVPIGFPLGSRLVRVQVDGAESRLERQDDATQPDPLKKQFVGPKVVVT
jgi:uncharacterized protein DUF4255